MGALAALALLAARQAEPGRRTVARPARRRAAHTARRLRGPPALRPQRALPRHHALPHLLGHRHPVHRDVARRCRVQLGAVPRLAPADTQHRRATGADLGHRRRHAHSRHRARGMETVRRPPAPAEHHAGEQRAACAAARKRALRFRPAVAPHGSDRAGADQRPVQRGVGVLVAVLLRHRGGDTGRRVLGLRDGGLALRALVGARGTDVRDLRLRGVAVRAAHAHLHQPAQPRDALLRHAAQGSAAANGRPGHTGNVRGA